MTSTALPLTYNYGNSPAQSADLYLPTTAANGVVCLLHGGFWRMPYGRDQLHAIAQDLVTRNWAVWNISYRRVGETGGGWPGTGEDVLAAINYLAVLSAQNIPLNLNRVIVAGHSAGGHLALWSGAQSQQPQTPLRIKPFAVASLAPVCDLVATWQLGAGSGAVAALMGSNPQQSPALYASASPIALLPFGVPQLLIHGAEDEALPITLSRHYADVARQKNDRLRFVELAGAGHMDFVEPASAAHVQFCEWLSSMAQK